MYALFSPLRCSHAALLTTTAVAQSTWQEYTYPDQQFAVSFPSQPTVTTMPFKSADGTTVLETVYSVRQGHWHFPGHGNRFHQHRDRRCGSCRSGRHCPLVKKRAM